MGEGTRENFYEMVLNQQDCSPALVYANRIFHRLNTKLSQRELQINDLVSDLSDGVRVPCSMPAIHLEQGPSNHC